MPDAALQAFAVAVAGVLGLVVGSFLNVVVARVPERRSLASPPSACPACGTPIKPYDNIPVFSWLLLRGRCRACGEPIAAQYPLVEAATGFLYAAIVWRFGPGWDAAVAILLTSILIPLAVIDRQIFKLPNPITYFGAASLLVLDTVAAAATGEWHRLLDAVVAAVVLAGFFWLFARLFELIRGKTAFGLGDVKLCVSIGLGLGWLGPRYVLVAFYLSLFLGLFLGIAITRAKHSGLQTKIPFGVFLAAGSILAIFLTPVLADWYFSAL